MTKDEALKQALQYVESNSFGGSDTLELISALREASAQPKHPEQMARLGWQYFECPACGSEGARAFPKPAQEPVAWMHTQLSDVAITHRPADLERHPDRWIALYTSPPQRQPLTDVEVDEIVDEHTSDDGQGYDIWCDGRGVARAIEAKHGIGDKT